MKVESGIDWGEGEYSCRQCGNKVIIENSTEILKPCHICGFTEFDCKVSINLSENGLAEKIHNSLTVLEIGLFLYKICKLDEFIPIIAVQLRICLCDTKDNSLIPKVHKDYKLFPITGNFINIPSNSDLKCKIIMENELFDEKKEKIPLNDWLEQIVYIDDTNSINLSIREIIRIWADKNGGAHVDEKRGEKQLYAIALFNRHLIEISELIISSFGLDWPSDIMNKIIKPIEEFKTQSNE